ncbi:hypothetical protein [Desulfurispora thermophila]|uniref:hypothetical protein n=1 Tax=Desulfurispora thermophila TaxID=265470 RepID=UPI00037899F9|nr:hypothetical protein [Desulfurispora thermophila]
MNKNNTTAQKRLAWLCLLAFVLAALVWPGVALARGGRGGFSGGGRSSFSSAPRGGGFSSSHSSYSSSSGGSKGWLSGFFGSSSSSKSSSGLSSTASDSSPGGGQHSAGGGYSTDRQSFATPRSSTPPSLSKDFGQTGGGYSTGTTSYRTATGSYSGSWDLPAYQDKIKYPYKPPVGVYGKVPKPPYYYHDYYWSLPWYARAFFQPNYYYTPFGYHYYAPRLLTWFITLLVLAAVIYWLVKRMRRV